MVVLTKADLCEDVVAARERIAALAPDVPLHTVSSLTGEGLDALWQYIGGNRTVALIGSSGVGKSTLINRLVGSARMEVGAMREDDKGGTPPPTASCSCCHRGASSSTHRACASSG